MHDRLHDMVQTVLNFVVMTRVVSPSWHAMSRHNVELFMIVHVSVDLTLLATDSYQRHQQSRLLSKRYFFSHCNFSLYI